LTLIGCLAVLVASASGPASAVENNPAGKKTEKKAGKIKAEKEQIKKGRRLPPFYKNIVSDEQRDKIFAVQEEYGPKIQELRRQLMALEKERDEKIDAILTPDQKKKINAARLEMQEKRKAAKEKANKPAKE